MYSTVITAELREKLLKAEFPEKSYSMARWEYEEAIRDVYGNAVGNGCIALQDKIGNYKRDRSAIYLEKEKEIRAILSEMPTAEEIKKMLSLVELDMAEFYAAYGEEKINKAIRHAKDLKDRYTVLWVYYDMLGGKEE